jgi:hypothetical protein
MALLGGLNGDCILHFYNFVKYGKFHHFSGKISLPRPFAVNFPLGPLQKICLLKAGLEHWKTQ